MTKIPNTATKLLIEMQELLARPQTRIFANQQLKKFYENHRLTKSQIEKIRIHIRENSFLTPLKIEWSEEKDARQIVSSNKELSMLQLGKELHHQSYYTHTSSLYALKLIDKIPPVLNLAKERKKYGTQTKNFLLTDEIIREQMNKDPKLSSKAATYKGLIFNFSEREYKERIGVIEVENREDPTDTIFTTNIHRTLIDLTINPEIMNGFNAVKGLWQLLNLKGQIDIHKIYEVYKKLDYTYPYWQRIGLLLDLLLDKKTANSWYELFDKPKNKFYAHRGDHSKSVYNDKWKIFYTL